MIKSECKIKWLQYFEDRGDRESGSIYYVVFFTILIICGFFLVFVIPNLFGSRPHSKQDEARSNVGAIGRAQQAYHLENGHFSNDLEALGIGIRQQTANYKYEIIGASVDEPTIVNNLAIPISENQIAYVGIVRTIVKDGETISMSTVCKSEKPTGKNPIWEGLPTQLNSDRINCDCIRVDGQRMIDLGG